MRRAVARSRTTRWVRCRGGWVCWAARRAFSPRRPAWEWLWHRAIGPLLGSRGSMRGVGCRGHLRCDWTGLLPCYRVLRWSCLSNTFTEAFAPSVASAAASLLTRAGYSVTFTHQGGCCGLTWISTGQRAEARSRVADLVRRLAPAAESGIPIVGLEPSCTAVLRGEAVGLLEGTADEGAARAVAGATHTVSEIVSQTEGWEPPDLSGVSVVVQPHCHQHAVMGFAADLEVLARSGATVTRLGGCCGMAGNFGMEQGHYEVSVAVAEQQLLPALRADPSAVLLADGFSCRTQALDLAGRAGVHLAQLLA